MLQEAAHTDLAVRRFERCCEGVSFQLQRGRQGRIESGIDHALDDCLGLQRPTSNLGSERQCPLVQGVGCDQLIGEPDPQCLLGLDLTTGDHDLLGLAGAHQSRQPLASTAAGNDPEQDLRLTEHCPLTADPVVASQRQLAPAAECVTADCGDHESRDRGDRIEGGVEAGGDVHRPLGIAELADVRAGRKDPLAAGDHHGTGRVGGQFLRH